MSSQVDKTEHMEDFFTTFELKCSDCQHWKVHQVLSSNSKFELKNHFTCLCDLKKPYSTICCEQGLECALNCDPSLVDEIQSVPMLSTLAMLLKKLEGSVNQEENDGPNFFFLRCQKIIQQAMLK